ncbi:MAG: restriction endonuclease [Chloroflexota bacterium]|nr:restriction endonuclease [Chloroflexota bacterium]
MTPGKRARKQRAVLLNQLALLSAMLGVAPFVIPPALDNSLWADFVPYKFLGITFGFMGAWVTSILLWAVAIRIGDRRRAQRAEVQQVKREIGSLTLSARQFESEVAALIEHLSGYKTEIVGGAGDQGVDIRVVEKGKLVGIVQCKYYDPAKTLPPAFIRETAAIKRRLDVRKAYLVTTARFSDQARAEASQYDVSLIDGADLRRLKEQQLRTTQPRH